jgi:quercetin dioxygenase-like cupin family protein
MARPQPIHKGDGVPIRFNEAHSLVNNGSADLELMIVGISAQKNVLDTELGEMRMAIDAALPTPGKGILKRL